MELLPHKGGIHVNALLKDSLTYEHIDPEEVGNHRRVFGFRVVRTLQSAFTKPRNLNLDVNSYNAETRKVIKQIKELENEGFQFEGADASLELLLRKAFGQYEEFYQLKNLKIIMEKNETGEIVSEAIVKLSIGDEIVHTAAEGDGQVNALDNSLRKAHNEAYPEINEMHLRDYKVRVLNGNDGTGRQGQGPDRIRHQNDKWSTVGVSENIIEASWQALGDSINYLMMKKTVGSETRRRST
jgi:2-isopropylmalate synthase